jgi:hypothetical protein
MNSLSDLKMAIHEGAVLRIRPKTMTVMTMMLGLLPILLGTHTGSDVMKRLAAPMFGGLLTSFTMELLIYPVIFLVAKQLAMSRQWRKAAAVPALVMASPAAEDTSEPGTGGEAESRSTSETPDNREGMPDQTDTYDKEGPDDEEDTRDEEEHPPDTDDST